MTDLEKVQKTLSDVFDYLNNKNDNEISKRLLTEVGDTHRIVENLTINGVSTSLMNKRFAESRERTARVREQIAIEKFIEVYYDGDDELTFEEVNKRLKIH